MLCFAKDKAPEVTAEQRATFWRKVAQSNLDYRAIKTAEERYRLSDQDIINYQAELSKFCGDKFSLVLDLKTGEPTCKAKEENAK